MIVNRSPSQHTRDSIHALVARQMADVFLENDTDLRDIDACRHELERANFGRPAIDALLERACEKARLEMVA